MPSVKQISLPIFVLPFTAILLLSGCAGLGPRTIRSDRFDYINAISDSWKEQMLLNIVKIRYGDVPIFMDISSVISQYSIESQFDARLGWNQSSNPGIFRNEALDATTKYTDKPTITYSPISGEKFARSLMTPIQPAAVMSLIQAGYPVDLVLRFCVHSVNGIRNDYGGPARSHTADPQFYPLLAKLKQIQNAGALGFEVRRRADTRDAVINFPAKIEPVTRRDIAETLQILDLDPNAREYNVRYGLAADSNHEIAMLTRSIVDMLVDASSHIDVPDEDVAEHRVNPSRPDPASNTDLFRMIRVHSGKKKPTDYLTTVFYRGHWYWIEDTDLHSKRLFSFMLFIFALNEPGDRGGAPIVTIPAG
jgi:hypothetical protein